MTEFYTKDSSLPTEVVQDICRYLETWCVWGRATLCWLAHFAPFIEKNETVVQRPFVYFRYLRLNRFRGSCIAVV